MTNFLKEYGRYAIIGLGVAREEIDNKINDLKAQINATIGEDSMAEPASRKKRVLSDEARKRIAVAQKKRWEAHRKAKRR